MKNVMVPTIMRTLARICRIKIPVRSAARIAAIALAPVRNMLAATTEVPGKSSRMLLIMG